MTLLPRDADQIVVLCGDDQSTVDEEVIMDSEASMRPLYIKRRTLTSTPTLCFQPKSILGDCQAQSSGAV